MTEKQNAKLIKMMLQGILVSHHLSNDGKIAVYVYMDNQFKWLEI